MRQFPRPWCWLASWKNDPAVKPGPSVRLGFVSAEYLNNHELYAPRSTSLLVVAKEGRKAAVEEFLETTIRSKYTQVETFAMLTKFSKMARVGVYRYFWRRQQRGGRSHGL